MLIFWLRDYNVFENHIFHANISNTNFEASACTGGLTTYSWDAEDRLTRIGFPGGTFAAYAYDGLGRRIEKNANGTITRYVYDGADILLEYDAANVLLARTTHGPGIDDPVMIERDLDASGGFSAAERFFYQSDGLGSIAELTDSTGAVARAIVYDSNGQISQDTGGIAQPYAFTGREFDGESDLYFYRARYYDPATGRFLSQDPLGFGAGDTNLYRYVFNNPVNFRDPDGRILPIVGCLLGAGIGGIAAVEGLLGGILTQIILESIEDSVNDQREADRGCSKPPSRPGDGPNPPDVRNPTLDEVADVFAKAAISGCVAGLLASLAPVAIVPVLAGTASGSALGGFVQGLLAFP